MRVTILGKREWIVFTAISLLFLGLLLTVVNVGQSEAGPANGLQVGYLAPDFILPSLDGNMTRLSDFRGKKAVFINFWATWCPPCRLEMPTMEEAYRQYRGRGLEILAISIDTGPKDVIRNFMQEYGLTFPVLLDPEGEVMYLYRIFSIPASFLMDKEGIIRFKELGYRDWTDLDSRKKLETILQ